MGLWATPQRTPSHTEFREPAPLLANRPGNKRQAELGSQLRPGRPQYAPGIHWSDPATAAPPTAGQGLMRSAAALDSAP